MITKVGFFRELEHGDDDGPSLRATIGGAPVERQDLVVHYLTSAAPLAVSQGTTDVLNPDSDEVLPLALRTDGRFVWPSDLAHYVDRYHAALPADLVDQVLERGGEPPELTPDELGRIQAEYFALEAAAAQEQQE